MKTVRQSRIVAMTLVFSFIMSISYAQSYKTNEVQKKTDFQWPEGKKMALSLSYDDARLSQIDNGIPLFDKYGVKATFYVSPGNLKQRLEGWKKAVKNGHDIGNHTIFHPCTGNFKWSRQAALEDYTLPGMYAELDSANKIIKDLLGIVPFSFGYPCGQTFVGRGTSTKSYIPLISSMFETGRGWRNEGPNDPVYCDMSQLTGMEMDGKSFDEIKSLIESAKKQGMWLILVGHEINNGGNQTSLISTIEALCKYALDPANGIWIDNVHNIASYINNKRGEIKSDKLPVYLNPDFSFDKRVEDLLSRMTLEEKIGQLNMPTVYCGELGKDIPGKIEGCRKFIAGTLETGIGPGGGLFNMRDILCLEGPRWQAELYNEFQKIAVERTRLKIPLIMIDESTHGLQAAGATIFPEGLAIGSTWNMGLVKEIYATVAREARSTGTNHMCTLVVEPNRDPRMGRNSEGYSEDSYLCSHIAESIVSGIQGDNIAAPDKAVSVLCHFPGQTQPVSGLENGEQEISDRTLREVFLPSWEAGIKKCGALGVMATYPAIDGVPAHASQKLLTSILRGELGFEGLVLSEGGGISYLIHDHVVATQKEAGALALKSGVDVGISYEKAYMASMIENVQEGKVNISMIDRAVRRILLQKFRLGLFERPYVDPNYAENVVHREEHQELALKVAREGIVLLKNENKLLPLKKDIGSIAVIGPNADNDLNQIGDYTTRPVSQDIVTVLEGIKKKVSSKTTVTYVKGCNVMGNELNEIAKAKKAAKNADIAIVVVGENERYSSNGPTDGEHRDVSTLDLTGLQEDLVRAVYESGTPTIVILINGRPLSTRWIAEHVAAIIEPWFCGEKGGNAIADVIFGDYNPSGRLPITIPRNVGQLPCYYNYKYSKAMEINGSYTDMSATPLFEFGFGLSYTSFTYDKLVLTPMQIGSEGEVHISLDVTNTGKRAGSEVVQLYINDVISSVTTPVKELRGFEKVTLNPGEKKRVEFTLTPDHLSLLDQNLKKIVEPGIFKVMVGSSSKDIRLNGEFEVK
ncbi:MAG: glycoside hydrolase family 3 C-terminal domain-containing protein [Bacteroidales bacterium]|nr:glycoside hydrolase family 3 C-terminal domain-containing protein [Bacteroidales bacterium]